MGKRITWARASYGAVSFAGMHLKRPKYISDRYLSHGTRIVSPAMSPPIVSPTTSREGRGMDAKAMGRLAQDP